MASLKKLAGQTVWYGLSSIVARFLNYLLTPYLTGSLAIAAYGEMSLIYAAIPFINVVFTYGMETTFFRFSNKDGNEVDKIYNTSSLSLFFSTLVFTVLLLLFREPIAVLLRVNDHPQFVSWTAYIIALDTLSAMPFAWLRNNNRPRKYAFIKIMGILVNIGMTVFFYSLLPQLAQKSAFFAGWYDPSLGAGYVVIANLIASAVTLLLLFPEILKIRLRFNGQLWREMIIYSLPIMIAGFGGMINETFDRIMLGWWSPAIGEQAKKVEVGIYSACYKLSILITLFIQAFRMGAEPFFFQQAKGARAQETYARVMNYFVITVCIMFLVVAMYLDVWKYFITNHKMWVGLKVVPILLLANMCLGIYYNLSIWYKVSHKTQAGAIITFIGAGITLLINYLFIPYFGYMACATATLTCYGSMMLISYFWGQKVYYIPYDIRRILSFLLTMGLAYIIFLSAAFFLETQWQRMLIATALLVGYLVYVFRQQKNDLKTLPLIGKFFK